MPKEIKNALVLLILLFLVGGIGAVLQALGIWGQVFYNIFPLFAPVFEKAIFDYLKSPYFIVGVIIIVFSSFGIFFTFKQRKALYFVISIIVDIFSLISLISNLAMCTY